MFRIWVLVLSRRVNLIKSSRAISRVRCTLYTDVSMSISVIIIRVRCAYQQCRANVLVLKVKVMLSLCFILFTEHHTMKADWGSGSVFPLIL
jgi:hypothetical protein